jgi:hypothetical protein
MRVWIFLAAALAGASPAAAQPAAAEQTAFVTEDKERVRFTLAGISVPRRAGTTETFSTMEFSNEGRGVDTAARYRSADEAVFATVYVYYPGIAHTGLQEAATEQAIVHNSSSTVRALGTRTRAAGGRADTAVESRFSGYLGKLYSSAAFVKADRWMVKLRVSGPEARAAEVDEAMSALLDGLRFEGEAQPHAAAPLRFTDCPTSGGGPAGERADDPALVTANTLVLSSVDPAGTRGDGKNGGGRHLPGRIGADWCKTLLKFGDKSVTLLRATGQGGGSIEGRSMAFILLSDAGGLLEVLRLPERGGFQLVSHAVGVTELLGTYDAMPDEAQLVDILLGRSEAGRIRARILFKGNGDTDIELPSAAPPGERTT